MRKEPELITMKNQCNTKETVRRGKSAIRHTRTMNKMALVSQSLLIITLIVNELTSQSKDINWLN